MPRAGSNPAPGAMYHIFCKVLIRKTYSHSLLFITPICKRVFALDHGTVDTGDTIEYRCSQKPILVLLAKKRGSSDMNIVYSRMTKDVVAYGPGDPSLAHTDLEFISLDEILKSTEVYRRIPMELLQILS